jgi:hypothetical protein
MFNPQNLHNGKRVNLCAKRNDLYPIFHQKVKIQATKTATN